LCTTENIVHIWIIRVSSNCLARCVDGVMRYTQHVFSLLLLGGTFVIRCCPSGWGGKRWADVWKQDVLFGLCKF